MRKPVPLPNSFWKTLFLIASIPFGLIIGLALGFGISILGGRAHNWGIAAIFFSGPAGMLLSFSAALLRVLRKPLYSFKRSTCGMLLGILLSLILGFLFLLSKKL